MSGQSLADGHWDWVNKALEVMDIEEWKRRRIGFFYKSAFVHGYKHGVEDTERPRDSSGRFLKKV